MNLIESLRSEVRERESEHAAQMAEREAQQGYYQKNLRPPMLQAWSYFSEIVGDLKFLDTRTPVALPISPDGTSAVHMEQTGYEFFYDDAKNPLRLDIVCECLLMTPQRFHLPTPDRVSRYTEFLDNMQFSYHRKTELDRQYDIRSAIFELEGPLKVGARVQASPVDRCVYVYLRNLEDLPEKRYRFSPEKIDSALLERLAMLILRQESVLVNVELCPSIRNGLREQVEAEKIERDAELEKARKEILLEQQAELEAKKLSTKFRSVAATIRSAISKDST